MIRKYATRTLGLIVIIIFITALLIKRYRNDGFGKVDYGRVFNEERIKSGRPVIEDYFRAKFKEGNGQQIWYTPDSLKSRYLHIGKNYLVQRGELVVESDYFRSYDSVGYSELMVQYNYESGSLIYVLKKLNDEREIARDTISGLKADSVLSRWRVIQND